MLSLLCSVRPGSLAISSGWEEQYLRWSDIQFFRNTDGTGVFLVIYFRWLKGERDPHHESSSTFEGIKFLLKPCKEAEHLSANATLTVTLLAIERGLFGKITLDDLMTHKDMIIPQNKKIAKQAVFVSLKGPNNSALDLLHPLNAGKFKTDGPGVFLLINFRWLKGERDLHHENSSTFNGITFLLRPCQEAEHPFADATLILSLLALERGVCGELTFNQVMNHEASVVPQTKKAAKQAVFVSLKGLNNTALDFTNPLNAGHFNPPLQRSTAATEMNNKGVSMYGFRREFITTAGRNLSKDEAMLLANQRTLQYEMNRRYDFGSGDLDILASASAKDKISAIGQDNDI